MTIENSDKKPIILPVAGILSEYENRPEYYDKVRILGIETDKKGDQHFILGYLQENGEIVPLKKRRLPERADDLKNYQEALDKLQKK